jgi:hypothetical protein
MVLKLLRKATQRMAMLRDGNPFCGSCSSFVELCDPAVRLSLAFIFCLMISGSCMQYTREDAFKNS